MMAANLSILNDPPKLLEGPQLLHQLINWDEHHNLCAIDFTGVGKRERYSYADIQSCVTALVCRIEDALTTSLLEQGQHIIPVLLPQSPSLYISQLAILESGGAFCPINLDAPRERIKFVVGDISANIIITTSEYKDVVSWEGGPKVLLVEEFPRVEERHISRTASREITPDELAYVMYTSGSSGTPKGVAVSHLAASQSLLVHESLIPPFRRFLQFAAPSFDVSVFEIFFPLTRGCTLVGCNRSQLLNDLPGMLIELEVDAAELTPTVTGSLLQKRANAPCLKLLLTIGEMLTRPIVEEFGGTEKRSSMLYGMYGPTEAAIHCTIYPAMEASTKPGNIGVPFATVSTFIAAASTGPEDAANLKFLPVGEIGELVLGGPQLAHGYLNREEQNKAVFIQCRGRKYYRTGDKARQLDDGAIEILGRMSAGQVKLRGQRVELGEIEDAVYKHPGVKTVVAMVLGSVLVVFALVENESLSSQDVMKTCSQWLPKFMVPSEIILLQKFPYLPSGKVDKRSLETHYQIQREEDAAEIGDSTTKAEQAVKRVLEEVLGHIQSNSRLAAAGLDSLTAIRVASNLHLLGFNVNTLSVLQAETFKSLVNICEQSSSKPPQAPTRISRSGPHDLAIALNGNAKDVESTMPCTPLQSAMLSETAVDQKAYRNWIELDLPDSHEIPHVISVLHTLASHNSILRTGFAEIQDSQVFVQIIWKSLLDARIELVEEFNYEFDVSKNVSLHHPLQIQILKEKSGVRLLLHIHHALYDAWSLELLLDDFETILTGNPLQDRPPFRVVVDGYIDGTLTTDSWSSKDYWKDHLAHLELSRMPDFHTIKSKSQELAILRLQTSIPTSTVESAARRLSTSPQSIFQAAYAILLSSYIGSSDICFGTVFSGRTLAISGIENIVGPCIATLPIRVDVSASTNLQDLVKELNSTARKHLEHSTTPLREIKSSSGANPRQQLFDTLIIWQQTLHQYDHVREHVNLVDSMDNLEFNLTLEIIPGTGNIKLKANYRQALFPESQVHLLLQQLEELATLIVNNESRPLQAVFQMLSNRVLSIENETSQVDLRGGNLSSPVEQIASEDPNRPAIDFAKSINPTKADICQMSYSQLNSRANQIGHHLIEQNVLPDELVCICMEKSIDLYTTILATAKIGAGYLPLIPDIPSSRLSHILQESRVKIVVAQTSSRHMLKSFSSVQVVYVDEVDFSAFSSNNIVARCSPEYLAYCVFTSGSTGIPKGVLVTQGNLLSNLDVLQDLYPACKHSRLLQSCSQAFDVSVFEIFFTWRIGGCLCSAVKDVLFQDIENAVRLLSVTHLSLTPTVASLINPKNVPKVHFLVTAGEAVTQKVFNSWADHGLWQGYGPSETTNICTVNPQVTHNQGINNIGAPFKNTSVFVLSPGPDFIIVPRGGVGELCFGGSQVFRGYMNKNQEMGKIIEHPDFGRLYRSGDFGRLMPDGSIVFTGRKDDQVKIRGQRVELGEINAIMLISREVEDCITMIVNGKNNKAPQLVCFWISGQEAIESLQCLQPDPTSITRLYRSLESALPSYMIPSALIPISFLPATAQGKIDKRILNQLFQDLDLKYLNLTSKATEATSNHIWTSVERSIAEAVVKVANVTPSEVGPNTSFFRLGIDSISAISLSKILRQNLSLQVEISDILKSPSVLRLAEKISSHSYRVADIIQSADFDFGFDKDFCSSTISQFKQAGKFVQTILPCTPLQQAILSTADSSSQGLYENRVIFKVTSDIEKLQACWQIMVQRHEILRTCFISTDMPKYPFVQVVLKEYRLNFDSTTAFQSGGSLAKDVQPPYSLHVVKSTNSRSLIISMNHALYDGVALSVLYGEVETLYHGRLLPPPVSFVPFLKAIISTNQDATDTFWGLHLKNARISRVSKPPQNIVNSEQPVLHTRVQRIHFKASLSWTEENTKMHSTSLLAACQTSWACLVSKLVQDTDICFGNVVSGRSLPLDGVERLVAPCFNTIPARLENIHNISYLDAFRKLQTFNADSLPFHLTPLRRIQSKFSPDGSRLFDTLLILQQPARHLDSSIWSILDDSGVMDFPLVCEVVPQRSDDTLELVLHSYTSAISEEDGLRLLSLFENKLYAGLDNPRRSLLSASDREAILKSIENRENIEIYSSREQDYSGKMSPEEKRLWNIIAKFTDVPLHKMGRDTSIFRLGLDSISSVQVAARLRKEGHNITASDILEHPTISQLNSFLARESNIMADTWEYDFKTFDEEHRQVICSNNRLTSHMIESIRPCTYVQQGMLAQTLHSSGQEYVNSVWFECLPDTKLSKLKEAWQTVSASHEMLRTGFVPSDDPKHPFMMVTYRKEGFIFPWFEDIEDDWKHNSISERVTSRPWSISSLSRGGQRILKFTAHHALYDAQSMHIILSDVARQYSSKSRDEPTSITSLLGPILRHGDEDMEAKRLFWAKEENKVIINRFPDLTPLRVSDTTSKVREITSQASTTELEELCRQAGVTMQAATQACWARILTAYIGETSTTFGITLSGRSVHECANNIAFPSIVTLPVRCDVTGTNQELLSRTMKSNALLHKHQFTPLTSIQRWAGHPEGKIFDTLFAYQKLPESENEPVLPWKVVHEEASVDYAISLEVQPEESCQVKLRLTFREDVVPVEHVDLLLKQYDAILLDTLQNPQNSCDQAPSLGNQLLSVTAANEDDLPSPVNLLHEFVERGAIDFPDKAALQFATNLDPKNFESRSWSYNQLNQEANKVANLLLQRKVNLREMIAICFDKCPEASFAIIGILKAGCSYVALDPNAPADRLKYIVTDSGAKLVLTAGKPAQNLRGSLSVELIVLDTPDIFAGSSFEQPQLPGHIAPEDVSYCLYTSGTTGTPKGCLITHENAVQFMLAFSRIFAGHWTEKSKYLQFASFHFDVSVMEQFWSWSIGICVASAPRDLIFEDIAGAINALCITNIDLTPSLARLLRPEDVPILCKGAFITGGEQLRQDILDAWGEYAVIYNGYGPTEATIGCTMYPRVPKNGKPANIGPAYVNVGTFVLKPNTEVPVLRGGIGELCVSGKLVGKGYLNRPDLTAEKFPTLQSFGKRVYRTGDLVRILHDGSFLFFGRADDQVKLRGQRLELSEINEVIKKSLSVIQEVVTLVLKHITQQKGQLVTFFVASTSSKSQDQANLILTMKDACKSRLPGYMVPTHFIPIKALPLNANNKADSKQLAAIYNELRVEELQKLSRSGQEERQWNDDERNILEVIAKSIGVEQSALTRSSNIFEVGLDSISIIGFSRALQDGGLKSAKLSVVKSNPSIGGLVRTLLYDYISDESNMNAHMAAAQHIAAFSRKHRVGICTELGVESDEIESIAPCSPVQEGMIYRFLESEHPLYFNTFEFRIDDNVDAKRLLSAWGKVIIRLEVLRTKFLATNDGFSQVVLKNGRITHSLDYTSADKHLALKAPYSLNLSLGFENILTLCIFHGLYDGNSLGMLLRCVVAEYHGIESIDYGPSFTSSLPHGPLVKLPKAQEFWTSHLKEWSGHPMPIVSTLPADVVANSIIDDLDNLEQLRKQLSVTPQAVIQAIWLSVLQTILSSNLTIGIVTSGRAIDFEGADKVIGPLFNTLPFCVEIEPGMMSSELITLCHDFNMKMQDFQHTPLKDIQKWSSAKPGQPLFDTLFVFQRPGAGDEDFAEGIWTMIDGEQVADYLLAFEANLSPDNKKLKLTIVAQGAVMTQDGAASLLNQFAKILYDTLRDVGKNVIIGHPASGNRIEKENSLSYDGPSDFTPSASPDGLFLWTEESEIIRTEIATLAGVSEEKVHEDSSIFEMGLDSIDVIKLSSRLRKREIELPVSVMIKSQTIAKMVQRISAKAPRIAAKISGELRDISGELAKYLKNLGKLPSDVEAVLPATPLQQSMVNEMRKSRYERYFSVDGFKLNNGVALERLMAAIKNVVRQSPILRTTFIEIDDPSLPVSFAQIVNKQIALSTLETGTQKAHHHHSFESFMNHFRAESALSASKKKSLFQAQCFSIGKTNYLAMAISHALYDGTSLQAIHKDIRRAYESELPQRPDCIPYLEEVFESTTDEAKRFWKTTLSGLPSAAFPRRQVTEHENPNASFQIERQSRVPILKIEALCKSSRITLQTLGQTCWALVLSHLMGQLDVVFGSVLSCRDSEEANEVLFPLMNTVAVRSVLHGSLIEMLRYIQDMGDNIRQYQHFPLGTAQAYALASRKGGGSTKDTVLFDTLFIYQGRRQIDSTSSLYESAYGSSDVEFPVCVEMEVVNDEYLSWTTKCKATARDAVQTEEIMDALETVLEHIVSNPNAQTINSDSEGISVCGLPKFKRAEEQPSQKEPQVGWNSGEWSDTELTIRKALHEISSVPEDSIRKDSTIFHLGLDSILVLKLPALLKKGGVKLSVSDILREQTVIGMARCALDAKQDTNRPLDADGILATALSSLNLSTELENLEENVGDVQTIMPVTAGELYMIRKWQATQGAMFQQVFTYTLPGPVNKYKLEPAWKELLARHEILRTGFIEIGGKVVQVVFKNPPNEIVYKDVMSRDLGNLFRRNILDLRRPPFNLVVEDSGEKMVTLKIFLHHALYDGISLPILIDEFQALYRGASLEKPTLNFEHFVAQSTLASSSEMAKQKWKAYLSQDILPLRTSNQNTARRQRTEVFHPSNPVSNIKQQAQEAGVTVDSLFLASISKIHAATLAEKTSTPTSNVILGVYLANRAPFGEDLSELVAPTLNLLPLLIRDPIETELIGLAKSIQMDLGMISGRDMVGANLEDIYEWTGVRVELFVNILKSSKEKGESGRWQPIQSFERRAEVVDEAVVEGMEGLKCEAYLPSIDLELRYDAGRGEMDIGVFAPRSMLEIEEAEEWIERFLGSWC